MKIRYAAKTDVGMKRDNNEDNLLVFPDQNLFAVFDGMGGAAYPSHVFLDRDGYITCVAIDMLDRKQMDNEIAVAMAVPRRKK